MSTPDATSARRARQLIMHILTLLTIRRLREHPEWGLVAALESARVFRLASGRFLLLELQKVLPVDEWYSTKGEDAVAALELADN